MINRPKNWDNVKTFSERPKLPVGAYVCRIKQAVVKPNDYGEQLCVLFDIEDGEYSGFYQEDFDSNNREDKKWKGVLRLWLPKDDGSDKDEITKSIFKGFVTSVEESNHGFTWNWNEQSLAKKIIGILFRNEEWEYEGKSGWAVRPFKALSVDSVADGKFRIPDDKPLKNKTSSASYDSYHAAAFSAPTLETEDDEGIPF